MKFLRIIAFPFSVLYGILLFIRNKLYDWGLFSSTAFEIPTISVGNLSVGGTGKTPHIEYLIRLLSPSLQIATLSRGYGRKTTGFILADTASTVNDIGDEPLQFKLKYPETIVSVDGQRVRGVKKILELYPSVQGVLLDDAFQHRSIKPGLSIVLSDFSKMYLNDFVVPTGTLREFRFGIKRADIIIVSKCPEILLPIERKRLIDEIKPLAHQKVYFSHIKYGEFRSLNAADKNPLSKTYYFDRYYSVLLLTGIASTKALEYYLKSKVKALESVRFPDHHAFTTNDLEHVKKIFDNIASANKIILTTEKDAMRLRAPQFSAILKNMPIFYMPIEIDFTEKDKHEFNEQILHYVRENQKHSSVYSK
ncbi:MAG: tetraacyldisaccharide 4'-kinase [Bacteroidota bacterium]